MKPTAKLSHTIRWSLSVALVVLGLLGTWAWGEVARSAAAPGEAPAGRPAVVYGAWPSEPGARPALFRAEGDGAWQSVALPGDAVPAVWAGDGADRVAVATQDGQLLLSGDGGQSWSVAAAGLRPLSLAWAGDGSLYAGSGGQGVYRVVPGGEPEALAAPGSELAAARVTHLAVAGGRLFAATPSALFYYDDGGGQWTKSVPPPGGISALAAADARTLYLGTGMDGVLKSTDAGQTWQPSVEGFGLAAGLSVAVTALRVDPLEPGVVYAAVEYGVGSTHVVYSAQGTFLSVDAGQTWQPMAGPLFPEAKKTSVLLPPVDGRPLSVAAVTGAGLQDYRPDVTAALARLDDPQPRVRAAAARLLGLARAGEAGRALLAALADDDPAVSMAAAEALGRIDDPSLSGALLVALDNPSEPVRLGAARALGAMKNEAAVPVLRDWLLSGQGGQVSVAAEALGRIGSPAALDALLAALVDPELTPRRHAALGALENVGDAAVDPLLSLLGQSEDAAARRNAAEALGWIASPRATAALVRALRDADEGVRQQAAWALGQTGDPSARTALRRAAAHDDSAAVQTAAQAALATLDEQPRAAATGPLSALAGALSRAESGRWLLLIGTWAAAAYLAVSGARLAPAPVRKR